MKQEIERKFLVDVNKLPDISKKPFRDITQGYADLIASACSSRPDTVIRVRQTLFTTKDKTVIGEEYSLAIKTKRGNSSISRNEAETILWKPQFHDMWQIFERYNVHKHRYEIPCSDGVHTVEYDIYKNELSGLFVAEVEFKSEDDALAYEPEGWFLIEITSESDMTNANLAFSGVPLRFKKHLNS